jgi:hypothetical protein
VNQRARSGSARRLVDVVQVRDRVVGDRAAAVEPAREVDGEREASRASIAR